jgi:16S rRNA processing protein RimM
VSLDSEWVTVAVLGKTRGNRGEVTARALSNPDRFENLKEVFLFGSGERMEVESTWFHQQNLIFKFRGIDTISDAERLAGAEVRLPISERRPLEPGEYFQSDLIGCEVVDRRTGQSYGLVTAWQDSGGPGVLEVDGSLLIPFARAICVDIDPASRRIGVELPEGLKDLNRS